MKKLTAIFFFVIYTATAFGLVVKFHFCDRELTHISLFGLSDKCACNNHSLKPMDCCKDKTACLKVNSTVTTQDPFSLVPVYHQIDLIPFPSPNHILPNSVTITPNLLFKGFQRMQPTKIYLLDRVFRI